MILMDTAHYEGGEAFHSFNERDLSQDVQSRQFHQKKVGVGETTNA